MTNATLPSGVDPEFQKTAIEQLRWRVELVDNKAVFLIGIVDAVAGAVAWAGYSLVSGTDPRWFQLFAGMVGLCAITAAAWCSLEVMRAVRPSERHFSQHASVRTLDTDHPRAGSLLWPIDRDVEPNEDDFLKDLRAAKPTYEYAQQHFVLLQLVHRKYRWYRAAVQDIKRTTVGGLGLLAAIYLIKVAIR